MIKLSNVTKKLSNFNLNIDFELKRNEILSIVGQSGSGKSTILKIIQGLTNIDSGNIIKDKNLKITYIFQEHNLLNNLTVFENVELALKINKSIEKNKVLEILNYVGLLEKKDEYPSNLSGGEKQRVSIARALVLKPDILLCDEPTSSLDEEVKNDIVKLFLRINNDFNTTFIFVSHELDVVKKISDRVLLLEKGKIIDEFKNTKIDKLENISFNTYVKEYFK